MEGSVIAAAQKPIRASALLDRVRDAAWHTKRSWYAVTENDRMLSPIVQRETANRIGAEMLLLTPVMSHFFRSRSKRQA
jgi:hypothetical protein